MPASQEPGASMPRTALQDNSFMVAARRRRYAFALWLA